ncbi:MAG TPA: hypothetical protein VM680_10830 [Verrucomicrobiae bacterium]|nr:hypothetical protein [Verrucomicrobiae bacterium]
MKNETSSRWTGRPNLSANLNSVQASGQPKLAPFRRFAPQTKDRSGLIIHSTTEPTLRKKERNRWKAPITAEYLQALREADELVFKAIIRGAVVRHTARVLKAV